MTLTRAEWVDVVDEMRRRYLATVPPGLLSRIEAMLAETPIQWSDQQCAVELDDSSIVIVRRVVRLLREIPDADETKAPSAAAILEAEGILRDHQTAPKTASYRVEHRFGTESTVLGYTSDYEARQAELSLLASRMIADGAIGELVLIDEATGDEVARRSLTMPES